MHSMCVHVYMYIHNMSKLTCATHVHGMLYQEYIYIDSMLYFAHTCMYMYIHDMQYTTYAVYLIPPHVLINCLPIVLAIHMSRTVDP